MTIQYSTLHNKRNSKRPKITRQDVTEWGAIVGLIALAGISGSHEIATMLQSVIDTIVNLI